MIHNQLLGLPSRSTKCPLCESADIRSRYTTGDEEYHVVDQEFDVFLCQKCKSYFINPIPTRDIVSEFYKFPNEALYGAYQAVDSKIVYSFLEKALMKRTKISKLDRLFFAFGGIDNRVLDLVFYTKKYKRLFHRVLDVGCGSGYFTVQLVKFLGIDRDSIAGIDIYPEVERLGNKLGVRMRTSRLEEFPESGFDLITLSHVLEHEPDPKATIREIHYRLSENGMFYLSVPNSQSLPARVFGKKWVCHSVPRHIFNFSRTGILSMTRGLFELIHYSSGRFYTFMLDRYYKSRLLKIICSNQLTVRLLDSILLAFNIGDNQSFLFKKI